MTRKRSKILFIFLSLLLVVCLLASFVSFTLPGKINGNYYTYTSFLSNLRLGQDIGKNVSITYRADLRKDTDDYNVNKDRTVDALLSIVNNKGYYDVAVSDYENNVGERGFRLDIGNTLDKTEIDEIEALIGNPSSIGFSSNFSTSGIFAGAEIVNYVTIVSSTSTGELQYYVLVVFTKEGLETIKNSSSNYLCLFLGDDYISYYSKENITEEQPYYAVQSTDPTNRTQTLNIANRLLVASLPLELTKVNFGVKSATFGDNATLTIGITLLVIAVAIMVYYVVKFGQLGWLACYNFLIFVVLGMFLLQAIPLVHINIAGIFGVLLTFWLLVSTTARQYYRASKLYNNGMKFYIAVKTGESETLKQNLIIHFVFIAVGFICLLFNTPIINSFGWTTFVLGIVSLFVSLAVNRLTNRMYLPFNSTDGEKCHFKKGGNNE